MNLTIHSSFLPQTDPDASLAFYSDVLGFEVRLDVGYQSMRWITVGPPGQPDTAIVLHPAGLGDGLSDGNDSLIWPHRDGLIWPRVRHTGAVVTV